MKVEKRLTVVTLCIAIFTLLFAFTADSQKPEPTPDVAPPIRGYQNPVWLPIVACSESRPTPMPPRPTLEVNRE